MNATRRTRKSLITALLPLIAVPMLTQVNIAHAGDDIAMDACIKAFTSANLPKEQRFSVRKIGAVDSPVVLPAKESTIFLTATGKQSGKRLAKATCVADSNGVVLTMTTKPAPVALAQTQASLGSR